MSLLVKLISDTGPEFIFNENDTIHIYINHDATIPVKVRDLDNTHAPFRVCISAPNTAQRIRLVKWVNDQSVQPSDFAVSKPASPATKQEYVAEEIRSNAWNAVYAAEFVRRVADARLVGDGLSDKVLCDVAKDAMALADWHSTTAQTIKSGKTADTAKPVTAENLTLWQAQMEQPWTVPYGKDKWWVTSDEGRLKHCLFHVQKSLGKIATLVERLDHWDRIQLMDQECDEVVDMAADLVTVALQIGTAVCRSVAHALVRRVTDKNGKLLDPAGGTAGRVIICK